MKRLIIFIMLVLSSMTMFAGVYIAKPMNNVIENRMVYVANDYIIMFDTVNNTMMLSGVQNETTNHIIAFDDKNIYDNDTIYTVNADIWMYDNGNLVNKKQIDFDTTDLSTNTFVNLNNEYIKFVINKLNDGCQMIIKVKNDRIVIK